MSDGIKAMWEDFEDYQRLCQKYGEKMRGFNHPYESDYRHHAELEKRERTSRKSEPEYQAQLKWAREIVSNVAIPPVSKERKS